MLDSQVNARGIVRVQSRSTDAITVSLDGVVFYVNSRERIALSPYAKNRKGEFRKATVKRQFDVCLLSGLVNILHANQKRVGKLPDKCRPVADLMFGVAFKGGVARIDVSAVV